MGFNIGQENGLRKSTAGNMRLASCGVTCLNSSSVFQLGFGAGLTVLCSEIPHERQAQNRYRLALKNRIRPEPMDQKIKTPFSEKINYAIILSFTFLFPIFLVARFGFDRSRFGVIFLIIVGCISIYKIYKNSKSVFFESNLSVEGKKNVIEKLSENIYFKTIKSQDPQIIKLHYQKYLLGLGYEIHFHLSAKTYEFNAFCDRPGIFDFGTRKRIIKKIETILINCASL